MAPNKKARFTFKSTGALFLLSALFDLLSPTSEVPLFGTLHGGAVAVMYHLLYAALFVMVGIGLWSGKRWGDKAVLATTALYTFDRIQRILSPAALAASLFQGLGNYAGLLLPADKGAIVQITVTMTWVLLAFWWAFAWYTYVRRDYFRQDGK